MITVPNESKYNAQALATDTLIANNFLLNGCF
jgi:hypothetical protein